MKSLKNLFTGDKKKELEQVTDGRYEMKNKHQNFGVKETGNFWKKVPLGKTFQLFSYASCIHEASIYMHGGLDWAFDAKEINNFVKVSLIDFSWKIIKAKNPPPPRSKHTAVPYDECIVIHGGQIGNSILCDSWAYFPETDAWSEIKHKTPKVAVYDHTSVVYGSHMYVFGGKSTTRTHNTKVYRLKIETGYWDIIDHQGDTLPDEIVGHSAHVCGKKMFVFGGIVDGDAQNDVFAFNFVTQMWTTLDCTGDIPKPRYNHSGVVFDHHLWVFSGFFGKNQITGNELYCLDFGLEKWKKIVTHGEVPLARTQYITHSHRNSLFMYGGWGGKLVLDDFQELKVENQAVLANTFEKCVNDVYTDVIISYRDNTLSVRLSTSFVTNTFSKRRHTVSRREQGLNKIFTILEYREQGLVSLDFYYFAEQNALVDLDFKFVDFKRESTSTGTPIQLVVDEIKTEISTPNIEKINDAPSPITSPQILPESRKSNKITLTPIRGSMGLGMLSPLPHDSPSSPGVPRYKNLSVRKSTGTSPLQPIKEETKGEKTN